MKLSISNIGWGAEQDEAVYAMMQEQGFEGLEIAPTRIFPKEPYNQLHEAAVWAHGLKENYGFVVPSMQSIWFGRQEKLFGTEEERETLLQYTKKAIDFAAVIGCRNLVFGCPRNRVFPEGADLQLGIDFFKQIGDYAARRGTVIGMEANPPIYQTNYINDTGAALDLVKRVNSRGFLLNLDIGTMLQNHETINLLEGQVDLINHVHISEPGLKPIEKRAMHEQLKELLVAEQYQGFVSIEMGKVDELENLERGMRYVGEVFCKS